MNQRASNWQQELNQEAPEEYNALRRSLQRNEGFGLFFVQCSPAVGENIISDIKEDISNRKIATLKLDKPIDSLYNEIEAIPYVDDLEILFISGLEHSLLAYEEITFDDKKQATFLNSQEKYSYSRRGVPRFLGYLNLQRDRFREDFDISFVFLVPIFGINYFVKRAPDFFDWRSGFFRFIPKKNEVISTYVSDIIKINRDKCHQEMLDLETLTKELELDSNEQAEIDYKKFILSNAPRSLEDIVTLSNQWVEKYPHFLKGWQKLGYSLLRLGRYEEAIASYDQAIKFKPDKDAAWYNRGIALVNLGRYEDAIASYDQAIKFKPDDDAAWYNRGNALDELGRYEDAIASYDLSLIHISEPTRPY